MRALRTAGETSWISAFILLRGRQGMNCSEHYATGLDEQMLSIMGLGMGDNATESIEAGRSASCYEKGEKIRSPSTILK